VNNDFDHKGMLCSNDVALNNGFDYYGMLLCSNDVTLALKPGKR
jgi:hypothetical protein